MADIVRAPDGREVDLDRVDWSRFGEISYTPSINIDPSRFTIDAEDLGGVKSSDIPKLLMGGFAGVGQGLGWLAKKTGMDPEGFIERYASDAVDWWNESLSDAAKAEMAKSIVQRSEDGSWEWGEAGPKALALQTVQMAPSFAGSMGAGAAVTGLARAFANPLGRSALVGTIARGEKLGTTKALAVADQARKKLKMVDELTGIAGFGSGTGALAGAQNAVSVEDMIMNLDHADLFEKSPEYRRIFNATDDSVSEAERIQYAKASLANEAGMESFIKSGAAVALFGAPMAAFWGRMLGAASAMRQGASGALPSATGTAAAKLLQPAASRSGAALKGGIGEGVTEFFQSGSETVFAMDTYRKYSGDESIDVLAESMNAALMGMIGAGAMGAGFGTAAYKAPSVLQHDPDGPNDTAFRKHRAKISKDLRVTIDKANREGNEEQAAQVFQSFLDIQSREHGGATRLETMAMYDVLAQTGEMPRESRGLDIELSDASPDALAQSIQRIAEDMTPEQLHHVRTIDPITSVGNLQSLMDRPPSKEYVAIRADSQRFAEIAAGTGGANTLAGHIGRALSAANVNAYHVGEGTFVLPVESRREVKRMEKALAKLDNLLLKNDKTEIDIQPITVSARAKAAPGAEPWAMALEQLNAQQPAETQTVTTPEGETITAPESVQVREGDAPTSQTELKATQPIPEGAPAQEVEAQIEQAGRRSATHPEFQGRTPTQQELESGEYDKGLIQFQHGIAGNIEQGTGTTRTGKDEDGNEFTQVFHTPYGEIASIDGVPTARDAADGDRLDAFFGPESNNPMLPVVVVNQRKPDGSFDEHKVMLGFRTPQAAVEAYRANYPPGHWAEGEAVAMPFNQFKQWAKSGKLSEPAAGNVVSTPDGEVVPGGFQAVDRPLPARRAEMERTIQTKIQEAREGNKHPAGERLLDRLANDRDAVVAEAQRRISESKLARNQGVTGENTVATDEVRGLIPEYLEDATLAGPTHAAVSAVSDVLTELNIDAMLTGRAPKRAMLLGGGPGSGKTTTGLDGVDGNNYGLIVDGTLKSAEYANEIVQKLLDNDISVEIVYTYTEPGGESGAFERALKRAADMEARSGTGRTLPTSAFVDGHAGSNETVRGLQERFGSDPRFTVRAIDNSGGLGEHTQIPFEQMPMIDRQQLTQEVERRLYEAYDQGRISEAILKGFGGDPGQASGLDRGTGSPLGRGVSAGRDRGSQAVDRVDEGPQGGRPDPGGRTDTGVVRVAPGIEVTPEQVGRLTVNQLAEMPYPTDQDRGLYIRAGDDANAVAKQIQDAGGHAWVTSGTQWQGDDRVMVAAGSTRLAYEALTGKTFDPGPAVVLPFEIASQTRAVNDQDPDWLVSPGSGSHAYEGHITVAGRAEAKAYFDERTGQVPVELMNDVSALNVLPPAAQDVYARAVSDMFADGVPDPVMNSIDLFVHHDGGSMAKYHPDLNMISVRTDILNHIADNPGDLAAQQAVRSFMAHELGHALDFNGNREAVTHRSDYFDLELAADINGVAAGDLMREMLNIYMNNEGGLKSYYSYPFGGLHSAVSNLRAWSRVSDSDQAEMFSFFKSEGFAQTYALYVTMPSTLKALSPKLHHAMERANAIANDTGRTSGTVRDGATRDGLRKEFRARGPAVGAEAGRTDPRGAGDRPAGQGMAERSQDRPRVRRGRVQEDATPVRARVEARTEPPTAQVSWESIPGSTTNTMPGIYEATPEQLAEFHGAINSVLLDENGNNRLAVEMGVDWLRSVTAPGVWEGNVAPSQQEVVIDAGNQATLDAFAAITGDLMKQDAVGWHKPAHAAVVGQANLIHAVVGQPLSTEQAVAFHNALSDALVEAGGSMDNVALISTPEGMRVLNLPTGEGTFEIDNQVLQGLVENVANDTLSGLTDVTFARADSNLVFNDWSVDSNGEAYQRTAAEAGYGPAAEWARSVLSPELQAVRDEFAQRYGWDQATTEGQAQGQTAEGRVDPEAEQAAPRAPPEQTQQKLQTAYSQMDSASTPAERSRAAEQFAEAEADLLAQGWNHTIDLDGNLTMQPADDGPRMAMVPPVVGEMNAVVETMMSRQIERDMDQVYELAPVAQDQLVRTMKRVARLRPGVAVVDNGMKLRQTSEEKMERKPHYRSAGNLTDVVRAGFTVTTPQRADAVVRALSEHMLVLDEGWQVNDAGYFDRKLMVMLADGVVGEVQLWTPQMLEAKSKIGHKMYKEERSEHTMPVRRAYLNEHMRRLYSGAMEASGEVWADVVASAGRVGSAAMISVVMEPGLRPADTASPQKMSVHSEPDIGSTQARLRSNLSAIHSKSSRPNLRSIVSPPVASSGPASIVPETGLMRAINGSAPETVQHWVNEFPVPEGINVKVHQYHRDAPAEILQSFGFDPTGEAHAALPVEAVFDPGTGEVHLFASMIPDQQAANRALVEEIMGHGGLRMLFGDRLDSFLDSVHIPDSRLQTIAGNYNLDLNTEQGRRVAKEEYIAKITPDSSPGSIWNRFAAWLRETLRGMGVNIRMTDRDLAQIMHRASEAVAEGYAPSPSFRGDFRASIRNEMAGSQRQQDIIDRVIAKTRTDMSVGEKMAQMKKQIREHFDGFGWKVKQGLVDSAASIERLERMINDGELMEGGESAWKTYLGSKNLSNVMAAIMRYGVPKMTADGWFDINPDGKGLAEIFRPLVENDHGGNMMRLWEGYVAALRAERLINEVNRDGSPREKLMSRAEIAELKRLGDDYPVLKRVHDDYQRFNRQMLDLAVEAGVLSEATRDLWAQHDYVPFYRVFEDAEGPIGPSRSRGAEVRGTGIKRLTGSERQLQPIMDNIVMNTANLVDKVYKHQAMQRIKAVAMEAGVMEALPPSWRPVKMSNKQLASTLRKAGLMIGRLDPEITAKMDKLTDEQLDTAYLSVIENMSQQEMDQYQTLFEMTIPQGPDVVGVIEEGKATYYRVTDPLLLRTIKGMGEESFGTFVKLMRGFKSTLTQMVTADPGFMVANWMRDTLYSWVTYPEVDFTPLVDGVKAWGDIWEGGRDSVYARVMMAGGSGGGFYDIHTGNINRTMKEMSGASVLNTPQKMYRFWRRFGTLSEQSNRIAIATGVLKQGGTLAEAAFQARDVTDFTRHGDWRAMKFLIQTVPFLNARIQGLYRMYRGLQDNPMSFFLRGGAVALASLALLGRNWGDDRYEDLPDWQKDIYWHIFLGDQHFAIPKPFEAGVIFGSLPERIARQALGADSTRDGMRYVATTAGETFALNPIPQMFKPMVEQWANKQFFGGRQIVPTHQEGLEPKAQYRVWTSDTARWLGENMPDWMPEMFQSPQRIEHLVRGYLGTIGLYMLRGADTVTNAAAGYPDKPASKVYDLAPIRRFYRTGQVRGTRYEDMLWEALDKSNAAFRTINAYADQGRIEDAREITVRRKDELARRDQLNQIAAEIRKINDAQRQVMYSLLDPEIKRERVDELQRRKNDLLRRSVPRLVRE